MWTFVGTIAGGLVGAFVGFIVATLLNTNCDSFAEQLSNCTRVDAGAVTLVGAGSGLVLGLAFGVFADVMRARRR